MGFSCEKHGQIVDVGLDSETKKWVIAGIPLRTPLKPIYTANPRPSAAVVDDSADRDHRHGRRDDGGEDCGSGSGPATPTGEESRIPTRLTCPPAPRKRKSSSKCNYGSVREFFTPPDLETVFIRHHVERAN
ncbi:cyclin-dependent kinase inhibitor SMR3-like protein [Parasponia andersonii]|uniref:Cyclin-dependent kinase inhibitor SMR3-like protein n=1 Tax=Parasponia andersonii TaxID=3476 RepID=A0A2P5BWF5_PARAD|nr:cyclin-dependent kinase inhibitor SMR3-like protein [Parasponia andersonii]